MVAQYIFVANTLPGREQAPNPISSLSGTWKPRIAPGFSGTACRKMCLWQCGIGMSEKAKAVL